MKKLLSIAFFMFLSMSIYSQNSSVYASIDRNCNSAPATLNIANGHTASGFIIASLEAGNNCHSGARFTDKGFVIKNSSGNIVFQYTINSKGQKHQPYGEISKLTLGAGIYYVYVDGGNGASLQLKFNM